MTTTIKVSRQLRGRVQEHAQREHVSQADVLARALDLLDRDAFFTQLRDAVAEHPETTEDRRERDEWLAGPVLTDRDEA